jgi:hypothetical protein
MILGAAGAGSELRSDQARIQPNGASLRRNMFRFRRAGEAASKINNEL